MSDFLSAPRLGRRAFVTGAAALGASSLAGGARAQGFDIPKPIVPLRAKGVFRWIDSGDQKAVYFKSFFAQYGAARGIETHYDGLSWNEIGQIVPQGVRDGTLHDVFVLPHGVPPAVAVERGWVQPYDDLIPDFETWRSNFPDGTFIEGVNIFDGKYYGFPYTSARLSNAHLLFNRPLVRAAGFDPETSPLDWDTIRVAARKVSEMNPGQVWGVIVGGQHLGRWNHITLTLAHMAGCASGCNSLGHGVDFRSGELVYNDDRFVAAVELLLALKADGAIHPASLELEALEVRALMPQGVAAMTLQGPWNIPIWEREHPHFDFGIGPPPAPPGDFDGHLVGAGIAAEGRTMFVYAGSRHPLIAADIFHHLGSERGQIEWSNVVGASPPPLFPSAIAASTMSPRSKAALAMYDALVKIAPSPFVRNPQLANVAKYYDDPGQRLATVVRNLFAGETAGVKQELTKLTARANRALDAAFAAARAAGAKARREDLVFPNWRPEHDYVAADYAAL